MGVHFFKSVRLFYNVDMHFYNVTIFGQESHIFTDIWPCQFFNCHYYNTCLLVSHCCFNLHFLMTDDIECLVMCVFARFIENLLWWGVCLSHLPIFYWIFLLLNFSSSLYILDTCLLDMFCRYFLSPWNGSFHLWHSA